MSKLSPALKVLVTARPGPLGAPRGIKAVYEDIARDAAQRSLGLRPWVATAAAATFALNSPSSLTILYDVACACSGGDVAQTAELVREVGLKCISINGIPRTINCLNAFRASLPAGVASRLCTAPSRALTPGNLAAVDARGRRLWESIYAPFADTVVAKLARAHPDLPMHILGSHYGPLLADPPPEEEEQAGDAQLARTGRLLTSVIAVACLRAQTGVEPQLLSHVYGLRKAYQDGTWREGGEGDEVARWLAGDEGNAWILRSVDRIVKAMGKLTCKSSSG